LEEGRKGLTQGEKGLLFLSFIGKRKKDLHGFFGKGGALLLRGRKKEETSRSGGKGKEGLSSPRKEEKEKTISYMPGGGSGKELGEEGKRGERKTSSTSSGGERKNV